MHNKAKVSQDNNTPEIVLHYNKQGTRGCNGVDGTRIYLK